MRRPSELIAVRASDLEPGRRIKVPRARGLAQVIEATADTASGRFTVYTDHGPYICGPHDLIDAEDVSEVCPP